MLVLWNSGQQRGLMHSSIPALPPNPSDGDGHNCLLFLVSSLWLFVTQDFCALSIKNLAARDSFPQVFYGMYLLAFLWYRDVFSLCIVNWYLLQPSQHNKMPVF